MTLDVSKLIGWLNAGAALNMLFMSVTLDVSKVSGWLNDGAGENMPAMVVTLEVSQLEKSALKFGNIEKRWLMSVMPETHQSAMGPYFAMAKAAFE